MCDTPAALFTPAANSSHGRAARGAMLKHAEDGLSRAWAIARRQGAAYTGGTVVALDADTLACLSADRVALLDVASGLVRRFLPPDEEVRRRCAARAARAQGSPHEPPPPLLHSRSPLTRRTRC